jgi:Fur family iron response transcriptional regulator
MMDEEAVLKWRRRNPYPPKQGPRAPRRGLMLRSVGLRPTRQRLALARLLFDSGIDRHVTAEILHEEAMAAGARVSLATVYNTLHQFTDMGLLREVVVDCGRAYFDTNVGEHHHFFFESEGRLEDIPADQVHFAEIPKAPSGTEIAGVDVIIRVRGTPS